MQVLGARSILELMNIDDLSKSQLLLLTVLVNFVTAIATAVLTVSLLAETPTTVTQTVNRIVDHTIETVTMQVPAGGSKDTSGSRDEELLTSAVASNVARTVKISRDSKGEVIATGVYLPKSRAIATSRVIALPKEIFVHFSDGSSAEASLSNNSDTIGIYGFSDTALLPSAAAAEPIASTELKLGQTVIGLTEGGSVVTGIISKVDADGITTTLPLIPPGAGVVNLAGNVIGIGSGSTGTLIGADGIMTLLAAPPES